MRRNPKDLSVDVAYVKTMLDIVRAWDRGDDIRRDLASVRKLAARSRARLSRRLKTEVPHRKVLATASANLGRVVVAADGMRAGSPGPHSVSLLTEAIATAYLKLLQHRSLTRKDTKCGRS